MPPSLVIPALLGIAEDNANPDDMRLEARRAIAAFIEPPFRVPGPYTARRLNALLRRLLKRIDRITPAKMPVRELPTPERWVN